MKGLPSGQFRPRDRVPAQSSSEDEHSSGDLQARILQELQKVNSRLDAVEDKVQEHSRSTDQRDFSKLSTPERSVHSNKKSRKSKKSKTSRYVSDSSSEEESLPSLSVLKSSRDIQRQVDARIAEIESHSKPEGNDHKLKSKRGGGVDVLVSKKVAWPHDNVLGGATRQRLTYDQLSLTQFIQGFTRNILDERDNEIRECMLWYLNDLMEDATDFRGGVPKRLMLCSSAKWRGAQLHGTILVELIVLGVLMHKNIKLADKIGVKKIQKRKNLGFVSRISLASAHLVKIMSRGVGCTSTSVLIA